MTTLWKRYKPDRVLVWCLFIFGGDLNAKHTDWHSRLITTRGRIVAWYAHLNNNTVTGPDLPTIYPQNAVVLDVFLYHSTLPISDNETLSELNSDHNPVLLTVDLNLTAEIRRNFSTRATKWNVFRDYLREISPPSGSCSSNAKVDVAFSSITETIKAARKIADVEVVSEVVPPVPFRVPSQRPLSPSAMSVTFVGQW